MDSLGAMNVLCEISVPLGRQETRMASEGAPAQI
jgi:hypothetical protein